MAPGAPGGPLGGPWRVPEGSQRVQILVFGHFEAIIGWVRPGLGQIDDVLTSYDFLWPRGPLGSPSLEGPKRVQICVFGHFEAIRG